jgi:GT2 family glycosyltransferase
MNGVIITVALRQKEATECLKRVLKYTPKPRTIIMVHCPGRPDLDREWPAELAAKNPEVIFHKRPGASGGMTGAWNLGFRIAQLEGCDAIVCMNDDVYVDKTWPNFFDCIRENPKSYCGPVSNKPGVDYTGVQKQASVTDTYYRFKEFKRAIKSDGSLSKSEHFCVNGFCFGLHASLCDDLNNNWGEVLDQAGYPWGGQEESLGHRVHRLGHDIVVDGYTHVIHLKFSDWRTHKLHNRKVKPGEKLI